MNEEMTKLLLQIAEEELLPFLMEGIGSGFAMGSAFFLLAYGVTKAISLLNINNR